MFQKLIANLITTVLLVACGGGALIDPYQSASGIDNGHHLQNRSMYYNPRTNTLYLEDSAGGVGRAINVVASSPNDSNWSGMASDSRKELIETFAKGINHKFSIPLERSRAIATALQTHHEAKVARGFSTEASDRS